MNGRFAIGTGLLVAVGVALIGVGLFRPWGLPDPHESIQAHHLQHFFLVSAGGLLGIALARFLAGDKTPDRDRERWLVPAILAPVGVMFAMWPTTYPYIEAIPLLHATE